MAVLAAVSAAYASRVLVAYLSGDRTHRRLWPVGVAAVASAVFLFFYDRVSGLEEQISYHRAGFAMVIFASFVAATRISG